MHLLEQYSKSGAVLQSASHLRERLRLRKEPVIVKFNVRTRKGQVQHRLTHDERNRLIAQYETGDSIHKLAERWRMSRKTVSAHLTKAGVERRLDGLKKVANIEGLHGAKGPQ